jgi:hypothetical protein
MPLDGSSAIGEVVDYNVADNVTGLIIPLPGKVYLPAEKADALARNALASYCGDWTKYKVDNSNRLGSSTKLGDDFVGAFQAQAVLSRTYLTYGWKYKFRAIRNNHPNTVRALIGRMELPRFVYVTEFSTADSLEGDLAKRRVFAHAVVDATAKNSDLESVLVFHAPGLCWWRRHSSDQRFIREHAAIADDLAYFPKVRGDTDFSVFFSVLAAEGGGSAAPAATEKKL